MPLFFRNWKIAFTALLSAVMLCAFGGWTLAHAATLNVKDAPYNAIGDGVANDTDAIQQAVNAAAGTGGTVYVPAGTYMIVSTKPTGGFGGIFLQSTMTLHMDTGAVLKAFPNNSGSSAILNVSCVSSVTVLGGTLVGERDLHIGSYGEWGMGIYISTGERVTIQNTVAKDCWGDGAYITYHSRDIFLSGFVADRNRRQGLSVIEVDGLSIINSTFTNTQGTAPEYGIDMEPNYDQTINNVRIRSCAFTNNAGGGFLTYLSTAEISINFITDVTLEGNTFVNNCVSAGAAQISVNTNPNGISLIGNSITGSVGHGIVMQRTASCICSGNTVSLSTAPTYSAIVDYDCVGNVITGNTLSNAYRPVYVIYSTGSVVTGNSMSGNYYGLYLSQGVSCLVSSNTSTGNQRYGLYAYGCAGSTVTCNDLCGNTAGAISTSTCRGMVIAGNYLNRISGPALSGVAVSSGAVNWTWSTVAGASEYRLYSDDAWKYAVSTSALSCVEGGLQSNTRYVRHVQVLTPAQDVGFSGGCTVYTLAEPPGDLRVSTRGVSSLSIAWSGNRCSWFSIEFSTTAAGWTAAVPANSGYTASMFAAAGLQDATTYYFRVYGYNSAGQATPFAEVSGCTLPAARNNSDAGRWYNVDGNAAVDQRFTVSGDAGNVTLMIPAGAITQDGYLNITTSAYGSLGSVRQGIYDLATSRLARVNSRVYGDSSTELVLYDSSSSATAPAFLRPLKLTLPYRDMNGDGLVDGLACRPEALRVYYLNELSAQWELVAGDQTLDKPGCSVTADIRHFSVYALISLSMPESDLKKVTVYPNPYRPGSGGAYDNPAAGEGVVFNHVTGHAMIRIYTVAGELVREIEEESGTGMCVWDCANQDGRKAASGVYIYFISDQAGSGSVKTGKLAIIR